MLGQGSRPNAGSWTTMLPLVTTPNGGKSAGPQLGKPFAPTRSGTALGWFPLSCTATKTNDPGGKSTGLLVCSTVKTILARLAKMPRHCTAPSILSLAPKKGDGVTPLSATCPVGGLGLFWCAENAKWSVAVMHR